VLFNNDGTRLIGTLVNTSLINSYTVGRDDRLTAAPGSPFPGQGLGAFGSAFSPTRSDQLFVSNPHNGAGLSTVSAFDDSANGTLTSIGASPFANGQSGSCWLAVTPDGRYLYATNTGSGTVSEYTRPVRQRNRRTRGGSLLHRPGSAHRADQLADGVACRDHLLGRSRRRLTAPHLRH
jgi:DNA-binding beta-propeller fold protein YncE